MPQNPCNKPRTIIPLYVSPKSASMKKYGFLLILVLVIFSCSAPKNLTTTFAGENFKGRVKSVHSYEFTQVRQFPVKFFSEEDLQRIQKLSTPFTNDDWDEVEIPNSIFSPEKKDSDQPEKLFNRLPLEEYQFNKKGEIEKVIIYLGQDEMAYTREIKHKGKKIIIDHTFNKLSEMTSKVTTADLERTVQKKSKGYQVKAERPIDRRVEEYQADGSRIRQVFYDDHDRISQIDSTDFRVREPLLQRIPKYPPGYHYFDLSNNFTDEYAYDKQGNWIAKYRYDREEGGITVIIFRNIDYY